METIYISSLPFRADEGFIRTLFGPFGRVQSVELHADWVRPTFEPYALVTMALDDAGPVVDALDGRKIGRTFIRVHQRTAPSTPPAAVFRQVEIEVAQGCPGNP